MSYYHYTDSKGIEGITSSGKIQPSTNTRTDALYGVGAYFTQKPPQCSDSTLLNNNYGGSNRSAALTEYWVKVPASQMDKISCPKSKGRSVCVVPGGIDLTNVNYSVGRRARYGKK